MDNTIQGIVLQSIRYGDTSLIVKVFTRNYGLRSYILDIFVLSRNFQVV